MNDIVQPKGFLKIQVFDAKSGAEIRRIEKPNLIVQGSKRALIYLLAQDPAVGSPSIPYDPNEDRLWSIATGDSATAPATSQTALQGTSVTYSTIVQPATIISEYGGIVEVEATFDETMHNLSYMREVGLFTRGDHAVPASASGKTMLARQIHGEIYKTASITVKYTWRYQITS